MMKVKQAATEFLNQVVRRGSDKAFVLGFDTTADLAQDFTDDSGSCRRRPLRSWRSAMGRTMRRRRWA